MYVIGDKKGNYISFKKGRSPRSTHNICEVRFFKTEAAALRMMSTIPKTLKNISQWYPIEYQKKVPKGAEITPKTYAESKDYKIDDLKELSTKIDNSFAFVQTILKNEMELENAEKELASIQQDLLHYIEFNILNAADGYNAYKLLHNVRLKRREIKDQLSTIKMMKDMKVSDLIDGALKKEVETMKDRKYTIRSKISSPIFEKKISKSVVNSISEEVKKVGVV